MNSWILHAFSLRIAQGLFAEWVVVITTFVDTIFTLKIGCYITPLGHLGIPVIKNFKEAGIELSLLLRLSDSTAASSAPPGYQAQPLTLISSRRCIEN